MSKTILITGGAGFVGSSLALRFRNDFPAFHIIVFDNLKRRGSELSLNEFKKLGIDFIHGDIRCAEDLDQIPAFDIMIEASAEPSVLAGLESGPQGVINNNFLGSINCFNLCVKYNAKVIFLSTSRVYPIANIEAARFLEDETRFSFSAAQDIEGISEKGISEKLSLNGARSFYGATKLASELFLQEYAEFYNIKSVITRFGVIAGPQQMGKTDQGVISLWMARHFWKLPLKYIGYGGKGKQVRDVLHIDDLIRLVYFQVNNIDLFANKVFNAGGGIESSASLCELTKLCEKITGNRINVGEEPENRPADLRIYITDNSRISLESGWKPEKNVEMILTDIFAWLHANETELKKIFAN